MQIVVTNMKGGCGKSTMVASLANVLDADIIDHDPQGTLKLTAQFTGRLTPTSLEAVKKSVVIHDTPPYNKEDLGSFLQNADIILIPCKVKYPDLVALNNIVDVIRSTRTQKKTWIVFNDVRKPHNKTYQEIKSLFLENFKDIHKATTELSSLIGFTKVFAEPLSGQALAEVQALIKELGIN